MVIRINKDCYSQLRFFNGEIVIDDKVRKYQLCFDENFEEKRKKINFYADGSNYTEKEKEEILLAFNELINPAIVINSIIEE